jgi:hypothetical protein
MDPHDSPSSEPPIQHISKRKVLTIDLEEEITSIFERIQQLNTTDVFLLVPERASLLQSVVNLTILKRKVSELNKTLALITSDPVGIKLALKAGIPVFDQMSPPHVTSPEKRGLISEEVMEPIQALGNEVEEDQPERLNERKLSIFDIVQKAKKERNFSFHSIRNFLASSRRDNALFKEPSRFALGAPSRKTLGTLVVASLSILFVISYIALPGATVVITPQSDVIEQGINITLANVNRYGTAPNLDSEHTVAYYPINITIQKSLDYTATGEIFNGTNATGTVTFVNERSTPWTLVALTRIQTEEGLIFRTQSPINVPGATSAGFGSAQATVIADDVDAYGRVIGEKGNIEASTFFLPGLREESRELLYARSNAPMSGGSTVVTLKITQEDLDASAELMKNTLKDAVMEELETFVAQQNQLNGTSLQLLGLSDAIEMQDPAINVPLNLVEAIQDKFQVSGTLKVSGVAYDQKEMFALLKEELEHRKSPEKLLIKVDEKSISHEIFSFNEIPGQIKMTSKIKGIEAYAIDPTDEHGAQLIKKIKEHIAGKTVKEAEDYVQNLEEVNKVEISSWPVWAPTIPTVFENIEVEVDETWLKSMTAGEEEQTQ